MRHPRQFLCSLLAMLAVVFSVPVIAAPSVIDGYTIEVHATGAGANTGIKVGPDGLVYVADNLGRVLRVGASGGVTVINSSIPYPNDLAFTENGRLFVVSGGGTVYEIVNGSAVLFASGFSAPTSIGFRSGYLYVANSGDGTISRLDPRTGSSARILSGFSAPNGPFGISFDPAGAMYFVDHGTGNVYAYDFSASPRIVGKVSALGGTFTSVGFNGQAFVTDVATGQLLAVHAGGAMATFASGFSAKAHPPAIGPNGLAFNGTSLFVGDGDTIYRITALPPDKTRTLRGMTMYQNRAGAWEISCAIHYGEIDGTHSFNATLFVGGPTTFVTYPYGGDLGPRQRQFLIREPGVTTFIALLGRTTLDIERTYTLPVPPNVGEQYYCQGGALDRTTGKQLKAVIMNQVLR